MQSRPAHGTSKRLSRLVTAGKKMGQRKKLAQWFISICMHTTG
jgi:hypothetical protein